MCPFIHREGKEKKERNMNASELESLRNESILFLKYKKN
jgi:hypothetical protein